MQENCTVHIAKPKRAQEDGTWGMGRLFTAGRWVRMYYRDECRVMDNVEVGDGSIVGALAFCRRIRSFRQGASS